MIDSIQIVSSLVLATATYNQNSLKKEFLFQVIIFAKQI